MMKSKYILLAGLIPFLFLSCNSTKHDDSLTLLGSPERAAEEHILAAEENPERFIYKHVIIVGIDGGGAFQKKCNTPKMDSIFGDGIWTPNCKASLPSISAQCWASMLIGIEPSVHGLTNKNISDGRPYSDSIYPTIFKLARDSKPSAKLAAFCGWTPISEGIIERNVGVVTDTGSDEEITFNASEYIKAEKPDLMFIQFNSADQAGHSHGFGKKAYIKAMEKLDGYIGKIYEAIKEAGILDDTLFILTADHGGHLMTHGNDSPSDVDIYFGALGKTVNQSSEISLNGRDLAAIVCYAMNLKTNANWTSEVPEGFFAE